MQACRSYVADIGRRPQVDQGSPGRTNGNAVSTATSPAPSPPPDFASPPASSAAATKPASASRMMSCSTCVSGHTPSVPPGTIPSPHIPFEPDFGRLFCAKPQRRRHASGRPCEACGCRARRGRPSAPRAPSGDVQPCGSQRPSEEPLAKGAVPPATRACDCHPTGSYGGRPRTHPRSVRPRAS